MAHASATPNMSEDDKGSRLCQFNKTKMCKFHVLGKCTKGRQCPFAHEGLDLRKLPDLRCTKLCKMLIQTGHCSSKSCMYAHSKEELRSTGAFHKTKLCRFMQTGHCTLGAKCNFAHSSVELREPETIESLDPPPGLGLESMIDELLSDEEPQEAKKDKLNDLKPAYVHVRSAPEQSWSAFSGATISEESTDCEESFANFEQAAAMNQLWDFQSQMAADYQLSAGMGCFGAEGGGYGGYGANWAGAWAPGPTPEQYTNSLFSSGFEPWDWRLFGDQSVVVDQRDQLKVKSGKENANPKMRSVRTSESTLCTLGDSVQAN